MFSTLTEYSSSTRMATSTMHKRSLSFAIDLASRSRLLATYSPTAEFHDGPKCIPSHCTLYSVRNIFSSIFSPLLPFFYYLHMRAWHVPSMALCFWSVDPPTSLSRSSPNPVSISALSVRSQLFCLGRCRACAALSLVCH